jgi:hypothetical protein
VKRIFVAVVLLCGFLPTALVGQGYALSPRVTVGGSKDRTVLAGSLEGRLEALRGTFSPYLGLALRTVENFCNDSSSGTCEYPSANAFGIEFGCSLDGSASIGLPLFAAIGFGGQAWHGWDPTAAIEFGLRIPAVVGLEIDLGVRGGRVWISERACTGLNSCSVQSSEKVLDTGAVVVGLRLIGGS